MPRIGRCSLQGMADQPDFNFVLKRVSVFEMLVVFASGLEMLWFDVLALDEQQSSHV